MGPKEKIFTSAVCVLATASIVYSVSTQNLLLKPLPKERSTSPFVMQVSANDGEEPMYLDGVYEGEAEGFSGMIRVSVEIEGGKIKSIQVLSQTETPEYYEKAKDVVARIVEQNSLSVDSVSGATITSDAIKEAVYNALVKAERPSDSKTAPKTEKPKKSEEAEQEKKQDEQTRPPVSPGSTSVQTGGLKDGTYIGVGRGWNGQIRVRITVKNKALTNIEILSHNEDSPYFDQALSVIQRILSGGSGNVSTVSGATYSSNGIIQAVKNALSQAKGEEPDSQGGGQDDTPQGGQTPDENGQGGHGGGYVPDGNEGSGEDVVIPSDLDQVMIKDVMEDGEYVGYAVGYQKAGRIKTTVTIENGEVKSIKVAEQKPEYADDIDIFRERAIRITEFMTGENARKIAAVSNLYGKLVDKIFWAPDPYEAAKELLGEGYAEPLKGVKPTDNYIYREPKLSGAIKSYLGDKYDVGDMFDAVTGATISSQGVGRSVENAMQKAVNDAKLNNDVKDTMVTAPKDKFLRANRERPLDLSKLRVTLLKKDGTKEELTAKELEAKGIVMTDVQTNTPITDGMSLAQYPAHGLIQVEVRHKVSLSNDRFSIELGDYSDDYVKQIHYSLDGQTWYLVKDPVMSQQNPDNISYRNQVIDAPKSFQYRKVHVRVVSQSGQVYEYETDKLAGASGDTLYQVTDAKGNSNVPTRLFVQFRFSGTEADKEQVPDSGVKPPKPDGGDSKPDKEVPVDSSVISTDLDLSRDIDYIEGQPIKPIKVTLLDHDAELIPQIENLPKGLSFNGTHIVGTPEVAEKDWDPNYYQGQHMLVNIRIKAKKGDVVLVKTDKLHLRRDQDKDGIADYNEAEKDQKVFNPRITDRTPIRVDGVAPMMKDYKARIQNLPEKGVQVTILEKPELSKKGMTQVKLGFKVEGLEKVGEAVLPIEVINPATEIPEPEIPELPDKEVPVDSSVISTDLDLSRDIDYIEGQPIKPIKVTLLDHDAELIPQIENLPKGLSFNGTHIVGTPEVAEKDWDPNYYQGQHMLVNIRIKAKKGDVVLVKTDKLHLRRDQDKDGIADYNEAEKDQKVFNAQLKDSSPIKVQGKTPTLEEYKAKIKNLPAKGVTVEILEQPNLSAAGKTKVKLGFRVDGLTKVGEKEIMIEVVQPAADQPQTAAVPEGEKTKEETVQETAAD